MRCLFGHRYRIIAAQPFTDTSWGYRTPCTLVVSECDRCGKIRDRSITATQLTMADLAPAVHEVTCPECGTTIRARMADRGH